MAERVTNVAAPQRTADRSDHRPARSLRAGARERLLAGDVALYVVVAATLAAGVAARLWILLGPLGELDADEASVGLIARHFLDGEFPVFVWGQPYGGTHGAAFAAAVFSVVGSGTLQLKLAECALFAAATFVLWRVGRRAVGPRAGLLTAALFWVWPGFLVYWSTKANSNYAFALLCEVVALLLVFRLKENDSWLDAALLGFALAQGIWASVALAGVILPFLVWLVVQRPRVIRLTVAAVPAFLVSLSPFLVWNATHGWQTLTADPHFRETVYGQRLRELFEFVLPSWFGVRTPYSLEWFVGPVVGLVVLALVSAGFVYLWVRRPAQITPLLLSCTVFPVFYASSPFAGYIGAPKYLVLLGPIFAIFVGWFLAQHRLLAFGLVVAIAASLGTLVKMERWGLYVRYDADRPVPADIRPLLADLERAHITRVIAGESLAPRITFESEERIIASGGWARYEPHERAVRREPHPAIVFVAGARSDRDARQSLIADGYRRRLAWDFAIYQYAKTLR